MERHKQMFDLVRKQPKEYSFVLVSAFGGAEEDRKSWGQ